MPISVILAFAFVFWRSEMLRPVLLLGYDEVAATLLIAFGEPILLGLASFVATRKIVRLARSSPDSADIAHHLQNRVSAVLRVLAVGWFAGTVFLTPWPEWLAFRAIHPILQIFGDWLVLSPFILTLIVLWITAAPGEAALREQVGAPAEFPVPSISLSSYLDLQVRHQLLTVAVPMSAILLAANLVRGYRMQLEALTGTLWATDVALAASALSVFLVAPSMLRRIWRTRPLEPGELRARLENLCRRIGLRCRDILVWSSDGMMVNAAVMGVVAPFRYVLLSDGLLRNMTFDQTEAVFGHEAGHVRHRHIPYFLAFALVGWLMVAGIMEILAIFFLDRSAAPWRALPLVEGAGILATVAVWALFFGRLSRRFERQADLFGATCATPPPAACHRPCSVHLNDKTDGARDRVCATGAEVFAKALERVALLNGIPRDEPSWRHSSIGERIGFLHRLAGDPGEAVRFQRSTRRLKLILLVSAGVGSFLSLMYAVYVLKMV